MGNGAAFARIVVVNHNAGPLLQLCVDALVKQSFGDFEAVIVDNASTDGSIEALRLPDSRFRLLPAGGNLGFAAGTNLGTADCAAQWIATLNPDAMPKETWLEELHRATSRHPGIFVFGSTQINARHPDRIDGFGDAYSIYGTAWRGASGHAAASLPAGDREVFAPCAAAAFYARDVFQSAGGFDETLFCYMEDVDLGFRLQLCGLRCMQIRRAEVLHVGSAMTGTNSDFFLFHSQRNRLWVLVKNVPSPLLYLTLLLQAAVIPFVILRRGGGWRASLRGVVAGVKGLPDAWRKRRAIQAGRRVSSSRIAKIMVWDPRKVLRHDPHFIESDQRDC